jgi:hypothetical protein
MSGLFFAFLTACLASIMVYDNSTWCSTPGDTRQPIWWFLRNPSPMNLNFLWLLGMLIPIVFVEPLIVGAGILVISGISAILARQADMARSGEWISSTALMTNCVAFWAIVAPYIRSYLFFPVNIHT